MGRILSAIFIAVTVFAGLVGFVLVGARTLERYNGALTEAQYDFVLARANEAIERSLQIGLPLTEIEQTLPILEFAVSRAPGVLAADVFSPAGVTIFSTDRGAVGEPVPPEWLHAIEEQPGAGDSGWRAADLDQVTIGQPILNDFSVVAGWSALIVERAAVATPLSLAPLLLRSAVPVFLIAALVAAALGALDRIGLSLRHRRLEAAIIANDPEALDAGAGKFEATVRRAVAATRAADAALLKAKAKMQALDAKV